jgi:hypothetical protein
VQGLGVDRWGGVVIASYSYLQRLAVGSLPVYITASPNPGCAGQTVTLSAQIAGSNDNGTVDFQIDGVSVGSASIANGVATKGASLAVGVRKLKAIYHGAGPFDGYPSFDLTFAVNQAGACQ